MPDLYIVNKITTTAWPIYITGATLLTAEEAETLPDRLKPKSAGVWWLRSDGNSPVSVILADGRMYEVNSWYSAMCAVRPALRLKNMRKSTFTIGDVFLFGNKRFEIISEDLAFCVDEIGKCQYRCHETAQDAYDYDASDVKKFVDAWFTSQWYDQTKEQ